MIHFGRLFTAMVTPFNKQGLIDFEKTTELVEYLITNGTEAIVVAGTTGESPTLTGEEKIELFAHVVKAVNKRVPVIAGTGSNSTFASIELTKKAEKTGVDAIMLVAPYYNKPSQEGLYAHFKAIANETKLPVMLYNIPSRSVINIESDTIIKLAEIPNIVALKEANGNLESMAEVISKTDENFSVYCGDDALTLPALAIGSKGTVSVASHVIGLEMQKMIQQFSEGDVIQAAKTHQKLLPMMRGLFKAPNPTLVKAALGLKGLDVGTVRLPLVPPNEEQIKYIENLCKKYE